MKQDANRSFFKDFGHLARNDFQLLAFISCFCWMAIKGMIVLMVLTGIEDTIGVELTLGIALTVGLAAFAGFVRKRAQMKRERRR